MAPVKAWLEERGAEVVLTASDGDGQKIATERPAALIGELSRDDVVYAAGAPSHVDAVRTLAVAAGATFYADPFHAAPAGGTLPRLFRQMFGAASGARTAEAVVAVPARPG